MKKLLLRTGVVGLMLAAAFVIFSACNGSGPDTAEADDYFSSYPYSSITRPGMTGNVLAIDPAGVAVENNGDRVELVASGGTPPYRWSIDQPSRGRFLERSAWEAVYERIRVGNNIVIVTDAEGQEAYCLITQGGIGLRIVPSKVTLPQDGDQAVLRAVGGLPGYAWSVVYTNRGNVSANSGTSVIYERYSEEDNKIVLIDSIETIAEFVISQPGLLDVLPPSPTVAQGGVQTFNTVGGTAPYTWDESNPSLGTVDSGGTYRGNTNGLTGSNTITCYDAAGQNDTAVVTQQ